MRRITALVDRIQHRIRLDGIDCPERRQPFATRAKDRRINKCRTPHAPREAKRRTLTRSVRSRSENATAIDSPVLLVLA